MSSTDLSGLQKTARSLILALRSGIEQLEGSEQAGRQRPGLYQDLHKKLGELSRVSSQMDSIWRMHSLKDTVAKRDLWKRQVEHVSDEVDSLKVALEKHAHRERRKQVEEEQRRELLQHREENGHAYRMDVDAEAQAMGHVERSKKAVEEMFEMGANVLTNMAGQRERLKGTQRKMLDLLNSVGLADSVLRMIERRMKLDKIILYGGMVGTILFVLLVWWFFRR
eukprot:jgi/Botrbrau1/20735/Bobra.0058s0063.1